MNNKKVRLVEKCVPKEEHTKRRFVVTQFKIEKKTTLMAKN